MYLIITNSAVTVLVLLYLPIMSVTELYYSLCFSNGNTNFNFSKSTNFWNTREHEDYVPNKKGIVTHSPTGVWSDTGPRPSPLPEKAKLRGPVLQYTNPSHMKGTQSTNSFLKILNQFTAQNHLLENPAPFTIHILFIHNIAVLYSRQKLNPQPEKIKQILLCNSWSTLKRNNTSSKSEKNRL